MKHFPASHAPARLAGLQDNLSDSAAAHRGMYVVPRWAAQLVLVAIAVGLVVTFFLGYALGEIPTAGGLLP